MQGKKWSKVRGGAHPPLPRTTLFAQTHPSISVARPPCALRSSRFGHKSHGCQEQGWIQVNRNAVTSSKEMLKGW